MVEGSIGGVYEETLAVFDRRSDPTEPLTTKEVATELEENRRTVYKRLANLDQRGAIESKKVGSRGRVWWRAASTFDIDPGESHVTTHFRRLLEHVSDFVLVIDTDGTITYVSSAVERVLGYDAVDLVGRDLLAVVHPDHREATKSALARVVESSGESITAEIRSQHTDGTWRWIEYQGRNLLDDPIIDGIVINARDVTERVDREQAYRSTARQLEGVVDTVESIIFMKDTRGRYLLMNQHCRDALGVDETESVEELTDFDLFQESTAIKYRADDRRAFEAGETIEIVEEVPTEIGNRTHLTLKSPVYDDAGDPYAVCAVSTDITERKARQRELERQREELAALDNVNTVVREITDAVIDRSTREEIEQLVCDRLANADSYSFAWIASVDPTTYEIVPRAEAGVRNYLDSIEVSADPNEPIGCGPAGKTFRSGTMHVSRDVFADESFEPWQDTADRYGFRSVATIPIVHEGTQYGVIGIYSDRVGAFAEKERAVIGNLGEVVGHAIAAIQRKRALLSDEVVEIGFQIRDVFDRRGVETFEEARIKLDRTVPIDDERFLVYGIHSGDSIEAIQELVDADGVPHWVSARPLEFDGVDTRFEATLHEPPVISTISSHDGFFEEVIYENGDLSMELHLPTTADVNGVVDEISSAYPSAEMVVRRQRERLQRPSRQLPTVVEEQLTDRQRAVLEASYRAGFFEWPRERSGEAVSDSLDITPSTFHQHLRKAEKKLLDVIFDDH